MQTGIICVTMIMTHAYHDTEFPFQVWQVSLAPSPSPLSLRHTVITPQQPLSNCDIGIIVEREL